MKIAILNQPQDPIAAAEEQRGSVAIVNWELARCLANRHQVIVYAPRARGQPERERWGAIEIRRISSSRAGYHKAMQLARATPALGRAVLHLEVVLQGVLLAGRA